MPTPKQQDVESLSSQLAAHAGSAVHAGFQTLSQQLHEWQAHQQVCLKVVLEEHTRLEATLRDLCAAGRLRSQDNLISTEVQTDEVPSEVWANLGRTGDLTSPKNVRASAEEPRVSALTRTPLTPLTRRTDVGHTCSDANEYMRDVRIAWNDMFEEQIKVDQTNSLGKGINSRVAKLVRSKQYDMCVMALIFLNTFFIGVQVEDAADLLPRTNYIEPIAITIVEYAFVILFSAELMLRLQAFGCQLYRGPDWRWHAFDTGIVVMMLLEQVEKLFIDDDFPLKQVASVRMLRAVRVIRAVRLLKMIRFLQGLRVLMTNVLSSLKSMVWTSMVVLGVVYMFGVIFAQGTIDFCGQRGGCEEAAYDDLLFRFGGIGKSLFSLFLAMTNGNAWEAIHNTLAPLPVFYSCLFVTYVAVAFFAIVNIVTGIFVENAVHIASKDREAVIAEELKNKEEFLEKLGNIFNELDVNGEKEITIEEVHGALKDGRLLAYLNALELDFTDVATLFTLLDRNQNGTIDLGEFLRGCMRLKGEARAFDIAKLQYQSEWLMHNMNLVMQELLSISGVLKPEEQGDNYLASYRISNKVKFDYTFASSSPAGQQRRASDAAMKCRASDGM